MTSWSNDRACNDAGDCDWLSHISHLIGETDKSQTPVLMQSKAALIKKKKLTVLIKTTCQLAYSPSRPPTSCAKKTGNDETAANYQFIWLQFYLYQKSTDNSWNWPFYHVWRCVIGFCLSIVVRLSPCILCISQPLALIQFDWWSRQNFVF